MRKTTGSPGAKLLILTAIDLLTTTLAIAVLLRSAGLHVGISALPQIAHGLISSPKMLPRIPPAVRSAWKSHWAGELHLLHSTPLLDRLTFLFGLPLYLALLKTVFGKGWNSLQRDAEDHLHLARAFMSQGRTKEAFRELSEIKFHTESVDRAYVNLYLLEGNVSKAKAAMTKVFRVHRDLPAAPSSDDLYPEFFSAWHILSRPARNALLQFAANDDLSEGGRVLCNYLTQSYETRSQSEHDAFIAFLPSLYAPPMDANVAGDFNTVLHLLGSIEPKTPLDHLIHHGLEVRCFVAQVDQQMSREDKLEIAVLESRLRLSLNGFQHAFDAIVDSGLQTRTFCLLVAAGLIPIIASHAPDYAGWFRSMEKGYVEDLERNHKSAFATMKIANYESEGWFTQSQAVAREPSARSPTSPEKIHHTDPLRAESAPLPDLQP